MPAAVPIPFAALTPHSASAERSGKIAELRRQLSEKFPEPPARKETHFLTGLEQIDRGLGLPRAAVTEICGSLGTGSLLIAALAQAAQRERCHAALVDGGRSFDTLDLHPRVLQRLLWVLCENAAQAVKAADLLLRDGNLPLILLDLQPLPAAQLRRIPASSWHRFHRIAEQGNTALVILTPQPMIEGVRLRIAAENRWHLGSMTRRRRELTQELDLKVFDKSAVFAALDQHLETA
jgi:hypothetical protein